MAKGRNPDRKYTGPPGYWGFSVRLTTPPSKNTTVTETQMKHQTYTSCLVGGSSPCERMTSRRQSQQHRIPTRSILLSPKQRTVIAAWNVRTMYEQGKASIVAMEMKRHNISLLGIAETRWIQTGQFRLSTGELILYSGHTHNGAPHTEGVGFMLSRQAEKALIGWQPVSSRLMTATFRTKQKRILVRLIMCYAPTNEASDEVKDQFYERLSSVLGSNRPERTDHLNGRYERQDWKL